MHSLNVALQLVRVRFVREVCASESFVEVSRHKLSQNPLSHWPSHCVSHQVATT